MSALDHVIVALDNMNKNQIFEFLQKADNKIPTIKIGLEQFCNYGQDFVFEIREKHKLNIFLDLKLHDIPNTVHKAIASLNGLPLELLTIHLTGGARMIEEALIAARENLAGTKIIGVTYLTSLDQSDFKQLWGFEEEQIKGQFQRLIKLALDQSLHGIVCSPLELDWVKEIENAHDNNVLKVCPGIRFAHEIGKNQHDQKRVMTPTEAMDKGADYLVMGRSLTQCEDLVSGLKNLFSV
ncbi:MAG: orotidine-5'-phosphate decarboxylase [Halobacteriovoraceae bacterium]|nr:orotidine-5'-phosphate decarboxylase [Halobacteriovoraceae bacterium]